MLYLFYIYFRDKRYNRSYSRDRGTQDGGRGGVASIGLHDERPLHKHRGKNF